MTVYHCICRDIRVDSRWGRTIDPARTWQWMIIWNPQGLTPWMYSLTGILVLAHIILIKAHNISEFNLTWSYRTTRIISRLYAIIAAVKSSKVIAYNDKLNAIIQVSDYLKMKRYYDYDYFSDYLNLFFRSCRIIRRRDYSPSRSWLFTIISRCRQPENENVQTATCPSYLQ